MNGRTGTRMWVVLAGALLLAAVVAGCATTSGAGRGAEGPPPIVGLWEVEGSSARFHISWEEGQLRLDGWDSSDGERFEILSVSWEAPRLRVSKRMPSTDHTTHSDLILVDPDTLSGTMTGGWEGPDRWVRARE